MEISTGLHPDGTAEVTVDVPPVNALGAAAWHRLAASVREAGRDPRVRAVLLRAEGRGFNAGVDIKELRREGHAALVAVNRGCADAFDAVYTCPVPVVAAVQGHCLGGGVGLAGNADIVVAAEDASFALPEVDRGALGAATHLRRLVPDHLARAMLYTCRPATAAQLHAFGSVLEVVPPTELRGAALRAAGDIAAKDPEVIRRAKESLNGTDPVDPRRSYRFEQGFTFELALNGTGDRLREAFAGQSTRAGARTAPDPSGEGT
ncbi:enoyl-CoA hydratase family protein [Nocardiopsis halophila]|uniref:enoyl-CoA hydratase family protein n=1 Tax=Nocardiopsis halophila TaxID=141692 RepID=UPI0003484FE0|nr:enoyl-CoA hydratase family protein [Nocardiopsis halophila]